MKNLLLPTFFSTLIVVALVSLSSCGTCPEMQTTETFIKLGSFQAVPNEGNPSPSALLRDQDVLSVDISEDQVTIYIQDDGELIRLTYQIAERSTSTVEAWY